MRRLSALVLHATAAWIMAWGWFSFCDEPLADLMIAPKGGYFVFLTHQGLVGAWSCMVVSLFCDVFPSGSLTPQTYTPTLAQVSFAISSIYWSLLFFLPHLIVPVPTTAVSQPTPAVPRLPLTIDLALHAAPSFTLMIDFFVFEPKFSKTLGAPAVLSVLGFWYGSFIEYCATYNGSFPYPFLNNPVVVRALIYTTTTGIGLGCFSMLNALHA
ncbi:hypothetical protein OG21DRAFT_1407496 [Imleria badia]|nr:hypothetical protein OG21DRAFT_1407496 [Imleria badia]